MRTIVVLVLVIINVAITVARQQTPAPTTPVSADQLSILSDEGQAVYGADCAECHADGGIGPAMAGNTRLMNKDRVVTAILAGLADGEMPAFAPDLTDRQVAAVSTFIRNVGDNKYGIVLEADVKRLREALKTK